MINIYKNALIQKPLRTKAMTSGFLFGFADFLTQNFIEKQNKIQFKRVIDKSVMALLLTGPIFHFWHTKYIPMISTQVPKLLKIDFSNFQKIILSVTIDQLIFTPFLFAGMFISLSCLEHMSIQKGLENGKRRIQQQLWDTMYACWKIWPIATFINLSYVPIHYRVLFGNFIGLFWNMYFSYLNNLKLKLQ